MLDPAVNSIFFVINVVWFQKYMECSSELRDLYEDKDGYVAFPKYMYM